MEAIQVSCAFDIPKNDLEDFNLSGLNRVINTSFDSKYEWAFLIQKIIIEQHNDTPILHVKSSTSLGLITAYIIYLNQKDIMKNIVIPDIYMNYCNISKSDLIYLSRRDGVIFSFNSKDKSIGIRDFIKSIGIQEYNEFNDWLNSFIYN